MSTQMPDLAALRAARREQMSTRRLAALLVLLLLAFCGLTSSMSWSMHQQIFANCTRTSQNLLEAEIAGIDRILTVYDASLRSAADTFRDPVLDGATPQLRRLAIFDGIQDTPELGPIRIIDADARVAYDSSTLTPVPATSAERRAMERARAASGNAALISPPFAGANGSFAVTVAHRLAAPDGGFAGIVIGTIDLDLFQQQFARLHVGAHDVVSLFSNDGVMLAHIPGDPLVGRSIAGSDIMRHFTSRDAGTFVARAALDPIVRVFSFRHISPWPVFVDVGVSTQDLYRPWIHRTVITACLMVALVGFTILLLRLLRRDLAARRLAELNLVASEQRYRMLAESASDVIVRVDRQTIRTYVSPSCARYGYDAADLVGLPSSSWVHDDDVVAARTVFLRVIDEQVDGAVNYRLRHKSGEYTWVRSHLSPIQLGGYLAIIREIVGETPEVPAVEETQRAEPASLDALTGLADEEAFARALPSFWQEATTAARPVSLVVVDLDRFASYRSDYGETAAGEALAATARLLERHAAPSGGVVARLGDNRFAMILPDIELGGAIEVANALRVAVWNARLEHAQAPTGRVTVSVGAACVMPGMGSSSPEALVRAAEEALARVKQGGRNQVQAALALT